MKPTDHSNKKLYLSFALGALVQASTYVYYVLMPILVLGLNAQPQEIKLTVTVFFLGFVISLLCSGPFLGRLGEKNAFIAGSSIFLIGTMICFFSSTVHTIMCGRFIQGLALGLFKILAKSVIASSIERTKNFAVYQTICSITPPVAMLITSFILFFFPWQAAFIFLLIISIFIFWLGLYGAVANQSPSTEPEGFIVHFKIYWILLKDKRFQPLIVSYGLVYAIMGPFYVTSTYTLTHILHYPVRVIGLITALFTAASMVGAYASILVEKTKFEDHILAVGFSLALLGVLGLYICALLFPPSIISLVVPLLFYCFGKNLFYAKLNVLFMNNFESNSRDVTLSAMAICIALTTSISTLFTSFHGHETFAQTARLMLIMVILSIGFYKLFCVRAQSGVEA